MFPVWFFILLAGVISYLLYITRTTDDDILAITKNQFKRLHYRAKASEPENEAAAN